MEIVEAMSGSLTDQVTVLRPLELHSHDSQWRKAVWCVSASFLLHALLFPRPSKGCHVGVVQQLLQGPMTMLSICTSG